MTDEPWWHDPDHPHGQFDPGRQGSAAEEAARLFTAMRDRMMSDPNTLRAGMKIMEAFTSFTPSGGSASSGVAPGEAAACAYCPVCQAIAKGRNLNPEAVERLTGAAMEFAETVRQVVQTTPAPGPDVVRHVPLDEDFGDWPEPVDIDEDADPSPRAGRSEPVGTDNPNNGETPLPDQ